MLYNSRKNGINNIIKVLKNAFYKDIILFYLDYRSINMTFGIKNNIVL